MTLSKSKLQAALLAGISLYIGLILYNGSVVGASVGHVWMMGDWLIN